MIKLLQYIDDNCQNAGQQSSTSLIHPSVKYLIAIQDEIKIEEPSKIARLISVGETAFLLNVKVEMVINLILNNYLHPLIFPKIRDRYKRIKIDKQNIDMIQLRKIASSLEIHLENKDDLMTPEDVRKMLKVSFPLVYKMADHGQLPYLKMSYLDNEKNPKTMIRFRTQDIVEFVNRNHMHNKFRKGSDKIAMPQKG